MSLRTRIKGFTAWVNLRLMRYDHLLNNVLMDLLSGTHMKYLVESITGLDIKRLESFDDLSQQQKQTRVDWIVDELKKASILPSDVMVDTRLFAMRSADQVFDLLWRLISHDIWFVWERAEYLQQLDEDVLCQVPFKWTPEPPPTKKKKKQQKKSLLSGFGGAGSQDELDEEDLVDWIKWPNADYVKNFKKKKREFGDYPSPDDCILEMVNYQLKTVKDGKNLFCYSIDDLVDSRVLCALVNSFVPNTFTSDLLLNDRWTINMALKTAENMFYADTPFDSEDLVEADPMAVCSYFCYFFMMAYKFRQCRAVVNRFDFIGMLIREAQHEIDKFAPIVANMQELQRRKELKNEIEMHRQAQEKIKKKFDIDYCKRWMQHIEHAKSEVRRAIRDKMRSRFDVITIPRNVTVNDLCLSFVINLSLTNGSGFYEVTSKEMWSEGRKLVIRNKETGDYTDDFSGVSKGPSVKELLKLPDAGVLEIMPGDNPDYEIYIEAPSRNKQLKAGIKFLYQVFPGNTGSWQRLFIKSARDNEFETVEKMIIFFQSHPQFINAKEPKSGNTALHWACRNGHFEIVRLLLENGANIDSKNILKNTPLNAGIEGLQRKICHYLIEWGCDVHFKNAKNLTPFETVKNDEFKRYLIELYEYYSVIVPKIMAGDMKLMNRVIKDHATGVKELCCLRSRCINGSTLLHTAAYYGHKETIRELLRLRVDINVRDYKGATPLHRSKNTEIMESLLDAGAMVDAEDVEGNTPLHVKCYGESNKASDLTSLELLLNKNANLSKRNSRGLLPIHCCAMQGRIDVMRMMMRYDHDGFMAKAIAGEETNKPPPSLLNLAIANDFTECAQWLLANGFYFKEKEQDILLRRILTEQITLNHSQDAVKFLLDNGADPNPKYYPGNNSALHYAASLSGEADILELLLKYDASVDSVNDDGETPLFHATKSNNQFAASTLIDRKINYRHKNNMGQTAFDYIIDYDEWIECGYFDDEIKARLKAYNLKHSRDLVRAISKKVKTIPFHPLRPRYLSSMGTCTTPLTSPLPLTPTIMPSSSHFSTGTYDQVSGILPAINRRTSVAVGYLIDKQSL
ncbi:uncharacterized protein LOC125647533 isoform X2 [Ostrea edulis]|uniref:uncharacterized protein LOC125647533 isoform X2 n=1 Tax=Ostrea edulis TaxID=37623 RepID=UPI0024AF22E6|nr:uncharacterized protein LOC125647533 isoform X2 [Ostrea edulis]XP_055998278.1 uncharacterized protein LOC125647533 isoform X2 [Ostrea edulis]